MDQQLQRISCCSWDFAMHLHRCEHVHPWLCHGQLHDTAARVWHRVRKAWRLMAGV